VLSAQINTGIYVDSLIENPNSFSYLSQLSAFSSSLIYIHGISW